MLRRLETRLPPPVLMLILALLVWWIARAGGVRPFDPVLAHGVGALLMLAGLVLNLAPKRGFRRAGTTGNPMRPQASTQLVTCGLYRYTRNPMYLGHLLWLAGWGLWWQAWAVVPALLLLWLWVTRLQVLPEERALRARFGAVYLAYCNQVRRWI